MKYYITAWVVKGAEIKPLKIELIAEKGMIKEVKHSGHYRENYDYLRQEGRKLILKQLKHGDCAEKITLWYTAQMGNMLPMDKPMKN